MNKQEIHQLLVVASALDNRAVTDEMVAAWHRVVSDIDIEDALRALIQHQRTSDRWLMPFHIASIVDNARVEYRSVETMKAQQSEVEATQKAKWLRARPHITSEELDRRLAAHDVAWWTEQDSKPDPDAWMYE